MTSLLSDGSQAVEIFVSETVLVEVLPVFGMEVYMSEIIEKNEQDFSENSAKHFTKLGFSYFLASLIFSGVQILMGVLIGMLPEAIAGEYSLLISFLPTYAISVPLIYFIVKRVEAHPVEKKEFSPVRLIPIFLVSYAAIYLGNIVGGILNVVFSKAAGNTAQNPVMSLVNGASIWQLVLVAVILAPIIEEFLFRKLLIDRLVQYGEGLALVVSALTFGFYHGNITQFVYATMIGMIFAYVYMKSGRIIYTMILHMIINFVGSVLGLLILEKSHYMEFADELNRMPGIEADPQALMELTMKYADGLAIYGLYVIILVVLVITGIVIFLVNKKNIELLPGDVTLEKGKRIKTVVLNYGALLFIAFWIVMMIIAVVAPGSV